MSNRNYKLKPLIAAIILGLLTPCLCAVIGSSYEKYENGDLSRLLLNVQYLELMALIFIGVLPRIIFAIKTLKYSASISAEPTAFMDLAKRFNPAMGVIILLLYIAQNQPNGLEALGLSAGKKGFTFLFFSGLILFILFITLYNLISKLIKTKKDTSTPQHILDLNISILSPYKTNTQRFAFFMTSLLMVIAEVMLQHGYLLLFWGSRSEAILLWALIVIGIYLSARLYEARASLIFQALFVTITVGLTISTGNIIMALVIHIIYSSLTMIAILTTVNQAIATPSDVPDTLPTNETEQQHDQD